MNHLNSNKKVDNFMIQFVKDAKNILQKYDNYIYHNLRKSKHIKDFYEDEWKGIGFSGINETILRYLISLGLISKYAIWPEGQYFKGSRRRADLAIYFNPRNYKEESPPDIIIEMKWGEIRRKLQRGSLSQWTINRLEEDLRKIRNYSKSPHNYVLQVIFVNKSIPIGRSKFQRQINAEISGHLTRHYNIKLLTIQRFNTHSDSIKKTDLICCLLCWKVH